MNQNYGGNSKIDINNCLVCSIRFSVNVQLCCLIIVIMTKAVICKPIDDFKQAVSMVTMESNLRPVVLHGVMPCTRLDWGHSKPSGQCVTNSTNKRHERMRNQRMKNKRQKPTWSKFQPISPINEEYTLTTMSSLDENVVPHMATNLMLVSYSAEEMQKFIDYCDKINHHHCNHQTVCDFGIRYHKNGYPNFQNGLHPCAVKMSILKPDIYKNVNKENVDEYVVTPIHHKKPIKDWWETKKEKETAHELEKIIPMSIFDIDILTDHIVSQYLQKMQEETKNGDNLYLLCNIFPQDEKRDITIQPNRGRRDPIDIVIANVTISPNNTMSKEDAYKLAAQIMFRETNEELGGKMDEEMEGFIRIPPRQILYDPKFEEKSLYRVIEDFTQGFKDKVLRGIIFGPKTPITNPYDWIDVQALNHKIC